MLNTLVDKLVRRLPIRKRQVLFISYYGSQYGCNPKYISQYLNEAHPGEAEITWAFTNPETYREIPGIRTVRFGSPAYRLALATSRVICTNYRMTPDFCKRPEQTYIQTWHSSLRLKKIEKDTEDTLPPHYVSMARHDSSQTDMVIAGCRMSHDTFAHSFWYDGEIMDCGTPRNDILINPDTELKDRVRDRLHIPPESHVVLYAPTFRRDKSTEVYNVDFDMLCDSLSRRFGGQWIAVVRLHPHLINCTDFGHRDGIIDATTYDDIQELMSVTDALVTDYSSLMFDFGLTGMPVFLYAPDVESYCRDDRGLYFDVRELPFPLSRSNDELKETIGVFDDKKYRSHLQELYEAVGSYEQGTASKSIGDYILNLLNK